MYFKKFYFKLHCFLSLCVLEFFFLINFGKFWAIICSYNHFISMFSLSSPSRTPMISFIFSEFFLSFLSKFPVKTFSINLSVHTSCLFLSVCY